MKFFKMLGLEYFPWTEKLIKKLSRLDYRTEYVEQGVKLWVARQIRVLREQRNWSQGDLAAKTGKAQSAISRLEDPEYGQMSLQTLLELAKAYDVALSIKFVDFPTFLRETKDVSTTNMRVDSFNVSSFAWGSANNIIISTPMALSSVERRVMDIDVPGIERYGKLLPAFITTNLPTTRSVNVHA